MKRKLSDFFSKKGLGHIKYVLMSIIVMKNWFSFLLTYIGAWNKAEIYEFRNRIKLKTALSYDSATIAVVFLKKDYGEIRNNSVVVDIGANIGVFSIYAVSNSKGSIVYAYEPTPRTYEFLLHNISINNFGRCIIPYNVGVSGKREKRRIFFKPNIINGPSNSFYFKKENWNSFEIDCITIEDIFRKNNLERVNLLKLDCEGAEFEILYSTSSDIYQMIDNIRLEYHDMQCILKHNSKYNIKNLTSFLEANNFVVQHAKEAHIEHSGVCGIRWFERQKHPGQL